MWARGFGFVVAAMLAWMGGGAAADADWRTDRLAVSAGVWDIEEPSDALEVGVDYEFGEWRYHLLPHVGVHAAEHGVLFGYGGVRYRWRLGRRITAVPSFAVALYEAGTARKDLGHEIEFRSGIDFDWQLRRGGRIGFGWYHLSNSGISRQNPGANSLLLRYRFGDGE